MTTATPDNTADRAIRVIHYWGGCPQTANSKWQRFLHLSRGCADAGWRTHLVWSRMPEDPQLSTPFRDAGCEIILQPRPPRNIDPACVWRTYRLLRRLRCDVFHCHNVHTSPLLGAALAGVPVRIWSKLAMSPYYERSISPRGIHRYQPSVRLSAAMAHRVLCISSAVRDELVSLGVSPAKLNVVPAPVDLERCTTVQANGLRTELGVTDDELVISTVGHAVPVKGWDLLLRAYASVAHDAPASRLWLVGSTTGTEEREMTRQLRELAETLGVSQHVQWLGQRPDIPSILQATDVFTFPSRSDGQGLALTEAIAAGLPCIASRAGGIPELIDHDANGLLFNREDVDGLARALQTLLGDSQLRSRLGQAARHSAQRFGLDRATQQMLGLYRELLDKQSAAAGGVAHATTEWADRP